MAQWLAGARFWRIDLQQRGDRPVREGRELACVDSLEWESGPIGSGVFVTRS